MTDKTAAEALLEEIAQLPEGDELRQKTERARAATLRWTLVERYSGVAFRAIMENVRFRLKKGDDDRVVVEAEINSDTVALLALQYGRDMADKLLTLESIEAQLKAAIAAKNAEPKA